MPRDGDFKRLVRRRMRRTGEAYTTARARLARRQPRRDGGAAMEPFDRFSARARRALAAAHTEAAGGDIGVDHLLLGLLSVGEGMAAKVLGQLGVDVRALAGRARAEAASSPACGRAIELAFHEAAGLGHGFVGTEHLLLGVLGAGGSAASRALAAAGVDQDRVRQRVRREGTLRPSAAGPRVDRREPLPGSDVAELLERARRDRLTGTMRLRRAAGGDPVELCFLFGNLFHAVHGDAAGDEAVLAALAWPAAGLSAELDRKSLLPGDGNVRTPVPALIERARTNLEP